MKTGAAGIALVEEFESCLLTAYRDGNGIWTIGWGHTGGVNEGDTATQDQADAWLADDLGTAESAVSRLIAASLNQNQFDALVSFTYNVGSGRLQGSTLRRMLNAEDYEGAAQQFLVWDIVAGHVSPGLQRRRQKEKTLFETAVAEPQLIDPNDSDRPADNVKGQTTEHAPPARLEDEGQSGG